MEECRNYLQYMFDAHWPGIFNGCLQQLSDQDMAVLYMQVMDSFDDGRQPVNIGRFVGEFFKEFGITINEELYTGLLEQRKAIYDGIREDKNIDEFGVNESVMLATEDFKYRMLDASAFSDTSLGIAHAEKQEGIKAQNWLNIQKMHSPEQYEKEHKAFIAYLNSDLFQRVNEMV
ncbi:MAG: hypothetical protein FWE31_02575 [Firmicutes bacterium]|nr:hypothetical protein [Bacillota bacterium]